MKSSLIALALTLSLASVMPQPAITNQPANQIAFPGGTISFSVCVTGAGPFTYQWQFKETNLPASFVTTIAGGGLGDGGAASNAIVYRPYAVALDGSGNLFIVDNGNNRIRKVDASGVITTVAGTGALGFTGDGGAATNAKISSPNGLAIDGADNLFIADYNNHRIRKVAANGIITTIAGKGTSTYTGDGGAATNAGVPYPLDVAVDPAGNLFIASYNTHRIRRVDTNGIITLIAGTGTQGYSGDGGAATNAMLSSPQGLAVDDFGNLFIAEFKRVRKVGTDGIITTVAGNGTYGYSGDGALATNAAMSSLNRLAVDTVGNLWVADSGNYRIRLITTNGIITTVAGNGANGFTGDGGLATNTTVPGCGVAVATDGSFFVAENGTARIRKVDANGIITTVAGNGSQNWAFAGNGCDARNAQLHYPVAVAVDPMGNLFVTDQGNLRIRRVSTNNIITTVAGNGQEGFSGDRGPATEASFREPVGVAADAAGNVFIADWRCSCVRRIGPDGIINTVAGRGSDTPYDGIVATNAQLNSPTTVALDTAGNLCFSDYNTIRALGTNGHLTRLAGTGFAGFFGDGGPATLAMLSGSSGLAVDTAGNVFIADVGNHRIRRVDTNGVITTVAGNGTSGFSGDGGAATNAQFNSLGGLAVDPAGNLFIADSLNHRIRKVDAGGIITTVAGSSAGFAGDGGPATQAKFSSPLDVAVNSAGSLFIADYNNHRIRQLSPFASLPTLILNNVTTNQAGDYRVIVTGSGGSVTSSVATLTVPLERPALTVTRNGTNLQLLFPTLTGVVHQIESTTSLPAAAWLIESAPFPGAGTVFSTNLPVGPEPAKFFRLRIGN